MPLARVNHEARLSECARRYALLFQSRARGKTRPWPLPLRALLTTARRLARQLRELMQRHWDIVVFDVVFGSLKAFGVYPALFALGLAWTIPMAEYAPLNTQLWTAGYLLVRRRIASAWGLRRYGYTLDRLDARRDTLLCRRSRVDGTLHRIELDHRPFCVTVRRSRWAHLLERLRGVAPPPGVISGSELRGLVRDAEFRLQADALRHNPTLYERVLLLHVLATPESRYALVRRLAEVPAEGGGAAEPPRQGPSLHNSPSSKEGSDERDGLAADLDAGSEAAEALLIEQADTLGGALGTRSMARMGLRWLHGAYRRRIRRERDDMKNLEYRLLAAHLDEKSSIATQLQKQHRESRARIATWVDRAEAFVARACTRKTDEPARSTLRRELILARRLGLRALRATAVARCLGGPKRSHGKPCTGRPRRPAAA